MSKKKVVSVPVTETLAPLTKRSDCPNCGDPLVNHNHGWALECACVFKNCNEEELSTFLGELYPNLRVNQDAGSFKVSFQVEDIVAFYEGDPALLVPAKALVFLGRVEKESKQDEPTE